MGSRPMARSTAAPTARAKKARPRWWITRAIRERAAAKFLNTQPVSAFARHGLNIKKPWILSADTRSAHLLTQQYLEAVLGLCWRFATSFSAQASLFDDLLGSLCVCRSSFAVKM